MGLLSSRDEVVAIYLKANLLRNWIALLCSQWQGWSLLLLFPMQEQSYLPSSSERKRAITAYLLIGLFFFSGKEDLTVYEYFHYKQAIGRYMSTMTLLLFQLMLVWIPVLKWLPFFFVLVNLVILLIMVFKAWKGKYTHNLLQEKRWKMFYADLGGRILGIFDIKKRVYWDISSDNSMDFWETNDLSDASKEL